ncbi:MAG: Signal peptidase I [uncultured bacterium]|nr:MAG: Signal peptidase I [uncultured bacterium]
MIYFNFETILTFSTILTGIIWLIDSFFFAKNRLVKQHVLSEETSRWKQFVLLYLGMKIPEETTTPVLIEYARSFFPILLLVLILRTFFYEPYRIPSGSDKPTLLIGDLILVDKHLYGWHLPVSNHEIFKNKEPKLGDIVIFRWSAVDPSKDLIKRVVGLPGDHVSYLNKVLYINGMKATQVDKGEGTDIEGGQSIPVLIKEENLLGVTHLIYQTQEVPSQNFEVIVPEKSYFVMGDNRDASNDSRYWGFVSQEDLKGKAIYVWLSWNGFSQGLPKIIRWYRTGMEIK